MISYSRYPYNHKHISWLTIPCTCLISQDSPHLCDDLVPIIYKQVSLNSPASENREPCTILKTLRKCPYSPVVVCSLIPICCSPDFPDHFSLSPQHFICCPRIRSHCFQTQTSLYPPPLPPNPLSTAGDPGTEETFREERQSHIWLPARWYHTFEWQSVSYPPASSMLLEPMSAQMSLPVAQLLSLSLACKHSFLLNPNQWGLTQVACTNLQELPTYAEWAMNTTKGRSSFFCDSTFPSRIAPGIDLI